MIGVDDVVLGRVSDPLLTTVGYDADEVARVLAWQVRRAVGDDVGSGPRAAYRVVERGSS